jgi:WD40 repeat protein
VATGKERRRLLWHRREVTAVAVTPDGHTLISASSPEPQVRFTDLATAEEVRTVSDRQWLGLPAVALSPDGKALVLGGYRRGSGNRIEPLLRMVEVPTGRVLNHFDGLRTMTYAAAFSPDGKTLAASDHRKTLLFWDVASARELRKVEGQYTGFGQLLFSPDGKTLATQGRSAIRLWDVATGKELQRRDAHEGDVGTVAFSPDGKLLATGSTADDTARIWDAATGRQLRVLPHDAYVRTVTFLPDGKGLLTGDGDSKLRFWDVVTGKEVRALELPGKRQVLSMRLSADGTRLLCSSTGFDETEGYRLTAWDVESGKQLFSRDGRPGMSFDFPGFSADGRLVAQQDGRDIVVREADTARERARLKADDLLEEPYVFSPDGKLLALSSSRPRQEGPGSFRDNYAIRVYDLATGKERLRLGVDGWMEQKAFSPDGSLLAGAGDDGLHLWDVATGKELLRRPAPDARMECVAFSPDGRQVATGLNNATVLTWEVPPRPAAPAPR